MHFTPGMRMGRWSLLSDNVIIYKLDPQDVGRLVRWTLLSLKSHDPERQDKKRLADYLYYTAMGRNHGKH